MNYHCPNCEKNLRWRLLQHRFAIKIFKSVKSKQYSYGGRCPFCNARLGLKIHASDELVQHTIWLCTVFVLLLGLAISTFDSGDTGILLILSGLVLSVFCVMFVVQILSRGGPRSWRRYESDKHDA